MKLFAPHRWSSFRAGLLFLLVCCQLGAAPRQLGPFLVQLPSGWKEITEESQQGESWAFQHGGSRAVPASVVLLQKEVLTYSTPEELEALRETIMNSMRAGNPQGVIHETHRKFGVVADCYVAEKGEMTMHFLAVPKDGEVFLLCQLSKGPKGRLTREADAFVASLTLISQKVPVTDKRAAEDGTNTPARSPAEPQGEVLATPSWALKPPGLFPFDQLAKSYPGAAAGAVGTGMAILVGEGSQAARAAAEYNDHLPIEVEEAVPDLAAAMSESAALLSGQGVAVIGAQKAWEEAVLAAQYGDETATREALEIMRAHVDTASAAANALRQVEARLRDKGGLPTAEESKSRRAQDYRALYSATQAAFAGGTEAAQQPTVYHAGHYKLADARMLKLLAEKPLGAPEVPPAPGQARIEAGKDWTTVSDPNDQEDDNDNYPLYLAEANSDMTQVRLVETRLKMPMVLKWQVPDTLVPGEASSVLISLDPGIRRVPTEAFLTLSTREAFKPNYNGEKLSALYNICLAQAGFRTPYGDHLRDSYQIVLPRIPRAIPKPGAARAEGGDSDPSKVLFRCPSPDVRDPAGTPAHQRPVVDKEFALVNWAQTPKDWDLPAGQAAPETVPAVLTLSIIYDRNVAMVYTYRWIPEGSEAMQQGAAENAGWAEPGAPLSKEAADLWPNVHEMSMFHMTNIAVIQRHMMRDMAELEREQDPQRRKALEWRILQARSDMSAENDLISSLEQGSVVHTPTAFDNYAHNRFIESIREKQLEMAAFQRERAALPRPAEQRGAMKAFVDRQLTPEVLANLDRTKLHQIASALNQQVQGHWEGEAARQTERAEEFNDYLVRAERVKMVADATVMIGCTGTSSLYRVSMAYATATGLATGGPAEAVSQAASYYSAPLAASIEVLRAYPTKGAWGSAKAGAVGFVMSKLVQLGGPAAGGAGRLTVREAMALEQFQQARAAGRQMVAEFTAAREALVVARSAGRPIEELRALERAVAEKVAEAQTNLHAKSVLKYEAPLSARTAFVEEVDKMHYAVEERFHQLMRESNWNEQQLRAIRNSTSAGTVNMDFDIMLVEKPGMQFIKDGKSVGMVEWQAEAQQAWEKAFHEVTGRDAGHALEELTTHMHPEAYKDMAWIGKDKSKVSGMWAQQAGDVSRYKGNNILTTQAIGDVDYHTRLMEAARGSAKDIETKLLDRLRAGRTHSVASADRKRDLVKRWTELKGLLKDIGEGRIDPIHGDRMVRRMTGGFGITDVIDHAATLQGEYTKRFSRAR